uniref:Ras-specific guanine nucleotide-releasing factor 2 n=1 Tax=Globodera pallida TaxID=36090 RepID=A0A183BMC2_GLOPA
MRPRVLLWKKIPLRINYEEESLHLIFGPLMKTLFERKWDFSFNQNSSEFYQDVNSFNEYIIWIMEDLNVFNPQFLLELRELTESIRLLVGEQSQPKMSVALSTLSVPALRQPHCVEQPDKRTFFSKIPISTFLTKRGLKKGGPKDGV